MVRTQCIVSWRLESGGHASCSFPHAHRTSTWRTLERNAWTPPRHPNRPRARRRGKYGRTRSPILALFNTRSADGRGNDDSSNNGDNGGNGNGNGPLQRKSLQSLIAFLLSIPSRLDRYYSPPNAILYAFRRTVWCIISGGAGFYAGNIVTLSFGALAINDVFAGAVTLMFYEVVTNLFYSEGSLSRKSLKMWFVNYFKMGVVLSCLADAIKLGG
jgi:hypothetical protein